MNTKLLSALTATAAATALFGAGAPAQAFSFGTNGITFGQDTDVNFKFKESHGAYTSSFGIYTVKDSVTSLVSTLFSETKSSDNGNANEWKRIYEANRDKLKDPDKIYPGQKLTIPPL